MLEQISHSPGASFIYFSKAHVANPSKVLASQKSVLNLISPKKHNQSSGEGVEKSKQISTTDASDTRFSRVFTATLKIISFHARYFTSRHLKLYFTTHDAHKSLNLTSKHSSTQRLLLPLQVTVATSLSLWLFFVDKDEPHMLNNSTFHFRIRYCANYSFHIYYKHVYYCMYLLIITTGRYTDCLD